MGMSSFAAATDAPQQKRYVLVHCMPCCNASVVFKDEGALAKSPDANSALSPVGKPTAELERYRYDPEGLAAAEIRMARAAGVDAFGIFLLGQMFHGSYRQQARAYWEAAMKDGTFKVYPEIWSLGVEDTIARMVDELAEAKAKYDDAWFKLDGKYVIYAANTELSQEVVDRLAAVLGGRDKLYLSILLTPRKEDVPGVGKYYHRPTPPERAQLADALLLIGGADYAGDIALRTGARNYATLFGKDSWCYMLPSFYHRRSWNPGWLSERLGPVSFRANWLDAAANEKCRVAYIMTWNDFAEDSGIAPDVNHGSAWLSMTRHYAHLFKTGETLPPTGELMLFHHPQVTEIPVHLPTGAVSTVRHNQQRTPPADYVALALNLKDACEVTVELRRRTQAGLSGSREVGRRKFASGLNFWLLVHKLADQTESALQNADPKEVPEPEFKPVYPEPEPGLAVDEMPAFGGEREIYVTVRREGRPPVSFRSSRPVTDRAGSGNHCTLADVWKVD